MSSNLTTFAGSNYTVPLIPASHEPAFCTASTSSGIHMWSHSKQFIGYFSSSSGEFQNSSLWCSNYSSSPSSSSSWNMAGTSQAGPHGHNYVSVNPAFNTVSQGGIYYSQGYQTGQNYFLGAYNQRSTAIWVNKTKRDNLCIQRANAVEGMNRTQVSTLGYGALMSPMLSTDKFTGGTAAGLANGYNTNFSLGLTGYNEKTKWWINGVAPSSGTSCTLYLYKGIDAPSQTTNLDSTYWDQFNNSTKITIPLTIVNGADTFDRTAWKVFPLDNGDIAVIHKYSSSQITYILLTGNNGLNSTTWTQSNAATVATTTSYQNTWQENMPAFVTYDGKYVVVYTQYYYYMSGFCGFIIRVSDGSCRKINHADTSYSYNAVMIGDNKMIISYGTNSDGSGQYLFEYDIGYLFDAYPTNYTDVTSYYITTRVDNPSASTCYPMIWTVPSILPRFNKGIL